MIANLGLWFAIHYLFGEVGAVRAGPLSFEMPRWNSVDPLALLLSVAALIAMLRLKAGMLVIIAACGAAGLLLRTP